MRGIFDIDQNATNLYIYLLAFLTMIYITRHHWGGFFGFVLITTQRLRSWQLCVRVKGEAA